MLPRMLQPPTRVTKNITQQVLEQRCFVQHHFVITVKKRGKVGPLSVEFAYSPQGCVGFLRGLRFPPTSQSCVCWFHWRV